MKLETLKKIPADLLNGFVIDTVERDGSLRTVSVMRDGELVVQFEESTTYGSLNVLVKAKPKMVKKWLLSGTLRGLPVSEPFESEYDANARKDELTERVYEEQFSLSVKEQEFPEE